MEIEEKKNKNREYKPILDGIPDWPVYQLSKSRREFIEEVTQKAIERIRHLRPTRKQLVDELETTVFREQNRMKRNRWRVDPKDDSRFWSGIKNDLVELSSKNNEDPSMKREEEILYKIVHRYSNEIAGNFKPSKYKLARNVTKFWFSRLLNGARVKKFGAFFRNEYTLRDKIHIVGKVKMLRKLAKKGTVVMVPTHFSNLDSILIGWVIHSLGLPAFIYGAGLNLFNMKLFAYFMNSLGAYKVDRRKKNLPYLETLKMYSNLALQKGAHSLFFPGGTRSRSGMLEKQLKLGLLSTAIEAQRNIYHENPNDTRKIFVVPVTINYHFVLEAPDLIEDYLQVKGPDRYFPEQDIYGSFQLIRFMFKFFTKGSSISVAIGPGLDVMGNYVNEEGESLDAQNRIINTADYFKTNGIVTEDHQREDEYTRMLSHRIVKEYHSINRVFASHLVAFVGFQMLQKKYSKLDLFSFLRLPEEELELDYEEFRATFKRVRKALYLMKEQGKINHASHLKGEADLVIKRGLDSVGIFHLNRPLVRNKKGKIVTQQLTLLYYYHNRLVGYDLEKFI